MLDAAKIDFVRKAMDVSERTGRMTPARKVKQAGTIDEYSPIGAEVALLQCQSPIEAAIGRAILPAYGFWRIYVEGSVLPAHLDRNACEISASLPILSQPEAAPWPIHISDLQGRNLAINLDPGDALIYQGAKVRHWREAYSGERQYQMFLHYVLADGEHADLAFDQRQGLNLTRRGIPDG